MSANIDLPPPFGDRCPIYPPPFGGEPSESDSRLVCMRDDELRRILTDANPWWGAAATFGNKTAWVRSHRVMTGRTEFDLGYRNQILKDVATGPVTDSLILLVGPRRVGKSVVLMDCIATLCARSGIDPRQIVHLPCDGFATRDLRRAITLAREMTRSIDQVSPEPRIWFFDEVGTIRGWSATFKAARDQTLFGSDCVIATGSRWIPGEDVGGNLFAGRAGQTAERRLRPTSPMTFREYLNISRPNLHQIERLELPEVQSNVARQSLETAQFGLDAYDLAWQGYLSSGGYPRAVSEYHNTGVVSSSFLRDVESSLRGEVDPNSSPDSIPLLLELLSKRATGPFNIRNAAEVLGYSRDQLATRIDRLIGSFAVLKCPQRDDHGREISGSQPKFYLADPLLSWLPSILRAGCASPDFTTLTEMTLGTSLARAIDYAEQGRWASADTIGYERTGSGNEIDFSPVAVPTSSGPQKTVPIESKWVDDGWRSESRPIIGKYGLGMVATKSILDLSGDVWAVPAPLVSMLLE